MAATLTTGQTVVLDGAADVNVVLGLVQLEAALLDRGLPTGGLFRRRRISSRRPSGLRRWLGPTRCIVRSPRNSMPIRPFLLSTVLCTASFRLGPRLTWDVISGPGPGPESVVVRLGG